MDPFLESLPADQRRRMQERTPHRHRSMADEARQPPKRAWPAPYKAKVPLVDEFINQAKREGRE